MASNGTTEDDRPDPHVQARLAADCLALALEEVGFDVGRAFPALAGLVDAERVAVVDLGRTKAADAARLAAVLSRAAREGIAIAV